MFYTILIVLVFLMGFFFIFPLTVRIYFHYNNSGFIVLLNFLGITINYDPVLNKIQTRIFFPFLEFTVFASKRKTKSKVMKNRRISQIGIKEIFDFVNNLSRYIKIKKLNFYCRIGYNDPAFLAVIIGIAWSILFILYSFFDIFLDLDKKSSSVFIEPDFLNNQLKVIFESIISIKLGNIIITAVCYYLIKIFRKKRGAKQYGYTSY
ncbi:DUF2953 domain-containing protein [Thermovenabulum gondwanense]|uniref:DUF2953 domain-containing protein n=1 Tax=Thermovenabulum gondwanense TaxID=520767 RepID=A0A162M8R6_9FIRM|nr:hypothetical protein ATZ99_19850 [Thermovenabulum gondwanense]